MMLDKVLAAGHQSRAALSTGGAGVHVSSFYKRRVGYSAGGRWVVRWAGAHYRPKGHAGDARCKIHDGRQISPLTLNLQHVVVSASRDSHDRAASTPPGVDEPHSTPIHSTQPPRPVSTRRPTGGAGEGQRGWPHRGGSWRPFFWVVVSWKIMAIRRQRMEYGGRGRRGGRFHAGLALMIPAGSLLIQAG